MHCADQAIDISLQTNQAIEISLQTNQAIEISLQANQAIEISLQTNQAIEISLQTNQAIEISLQTNQAIEISLQTNQAIEISLQSNQAIEISLPSNHNSKLHNTRAAFSRRCKQKGELIQSHYHIFVVQGRSRSIINVGTPEKLVSSACYDAQHVFVSICNMALPGN